MVRLKQPWCLVLVYLRVCHVTCDVMRDVGGTLIDLTHKYDADTPFWGLGATFNLTILHRGTTPGGYWYEGNSFSTMEHGGTHIDAPAHFAKGKYRLDDIPLDRLVGQGVRMDFVEQATQNPDYQVTVADIKSWESSHGTLPDKCIVLLNFGWTMHWPNPVKVFGTPTPKNSSTYHFPGLHPDAAQWIVAERPQVMAISIDTPSIDHGPSTTFLSHRYLFARNVPAFENVANTHLVPVTNSTIFAIPMKIAEGSGGPLRIFALVPSNDVTCSGYVVSKTKRALPDQEIIDMLKQFDINGDGVITATELGYALKLAGQSHSDSELQDMIAAADADGDGKVNLEEFTMSLNQDQPDRPIVVDDYMKQFDRNRDGFLDREELSLALEAMMGRQATEKELDDIFQTFDETRDGKISAAELAKLL